MELHLNLKMKKKIVNNYHVLFLCFPSVNFMKTFCFVNIFIKGSVFNFPVKQAENNRIS